MLRPQAERPSRAQQAAPLHHNASRVDVGERLNFGALGPEDILAVLEIDGFAVGGVVIEADLAGQIVLDEGDGVESSAAILFGGDGFDEADGDFCSGRAEVDGDGINLEDAVVIARVGGDPFADEGVWHHVRGGAPDQCGADEKDED